MAQENKMGVGMAGERELLTVQFSWQSKKKLLEAHESVLLKAC